MKKSKTLSKKLISIVLSVLMVLSCFSGMSLTAWAIAPEDATWSANQSITENTDIGKLTVNTDITVTIAEGKTVTVHFGIDASDHTLTVAGAGTLVVKGKEGNKGNDNGDDEDPNPAESGASGESGVTGNLVVNGATVQITGGNGGDGGNAFYFGGSGGSGGNGVQGNVTVIGGAITITGGNGGTGGQAYAGNGSNGTAGRAVTGTISGDAEESAEGDNWIAVSADTSTARYVKVTAPAPAEDGPLVGTVIKVGDTLTLDGDYIECMPGVIDQATDSFKLERMKYDDYFNGWGAVFEETGAFLIAGDETPEPDGFYVSGGNGTQSHPYTLALHYASAEPAPSAYAGYVPAATDDATALAAKVVKFNGYDWYLIEDNSTSETEGTVTLFAKDTIGSSRFNNSNNVYSGSMVKSYLDNLTAEGGAFADVADAIVSTDLEDVTVTGAKLWLLSKDEVITTYKLSTALNKCSNDWWLRTPATSSYVIFVNGTSGSVDNVGNSCMNTYGVRPALKLDLSKVTFDSETKTFALPESVIEYPLYVGGVQVTSENMSGEGWSYAADANMLTLDGATITGYDKDNYKRACIYYEGEEPFIIDVKGDNVVGKDDDDTLYSGIVSTSDRAPLLTIQGDGTLEVKGYENGIKNEMGDTLIASGKINATGRSAGINLGYDNAITINGGDITATSTKSGAGICVYGYESTVTITNGTVKASSVSDYGYNAGIIAGTVSISGGTVEATAISNYEYKQEIYGIQGNAVISGGEVTASGEIQAISGTVTNAIAGTGWTDAAGTEGKATIEKSMTGQDLSEYRKVQFPVVTSVYSLSLTDGTENAEKWKGKSGNDDEFKVLPLQEVVEGDNVIIQYTGSKRIENIKAVTENIATGTGSSTTETVILHEDTMQVSWENTLKIAKDKFTDINPGDKIVIEYNCESGSSLELRCNGEKLPGSRIENFIVGNGSEEVYATPATIKSLKKYGLEICGDDFTVSKVWYGAGKDGVDEYTVWSGYFWMDAWNTIVLATSCFNGVDWSTIKAIRFMSDAGRTDYVMNVRTAWDDEGKIADQSSMTRNENYFELSLANIDMATKLNGSGSFMIQCNKEEGEPFNLTQIQLIPDENAKKEVELTPVEGQSNTWTLEMPACNVELQVEYQPHVHDFVYTAEEATITATCTADGCDLTDSKATLTIVAPELNVYGGTENAEATISGSIPGVTTPDIVYSKGKKTLDAAPTNAGTYTASITIEGKTASVEYTIAKADPTCTTPTGLTATYGQTLADVTLTNPSGNTAGTWAWSDSRTSVGNVGTNTFKASFVPTDTTNYNTKTNIDVSVKVGKANQTAPAAPTEAGKTVNSITLNEIPNGEYKCGAGDWQTSPTFTGLTQNTTYTFRQRYAADANHNASAGSEETVIRTSNHTHSFTYSSSNGTITATCNGAGTCNLTDNKVSFTLTAPTSLVYNGTDKKATLEGVEAFNAATGMNVSADDIVYNYKATSSDSAVVVTETKNAGIYQALYTLQTDFPRPVAGISFTIAKADPACTAPTGLTATYGQTLADVTLTNPSGNTAGTWVWSDSRTSVGNVGTNTFKASFVPTDTTNYNTMTNIDVSVTVGKANITPTVSLEGWTYNQTAKTPSVSGNTGNGAVTYTYATKGSDNFSATVPTNAGNYTVKATIAATANYNGGTATADFTIAKANITPTVSIDGWTYNQTAKTPSVSGNSGNGAVTYTYATKGSDSFSDAVPTNAGEYTVKATVAATTNYKEGTATADFTIAKADISPAVTLDGWTYGDEANKPSVTGNAGNGDVAYTYAQKGSDEFGSTVPADAGDYTVKAVIAETANYNGGEATADFTIAKAKVTITADDKAIMREAALKELTYKADGKILDGDDLGIKVTSNVKPAVAGKYDIKVAYTENANYDVTTVDGIYTVTDRITATEKTAGKNKINSSAKASASKKGFIVKWGKVANAEKYEIYAAYCGKNNKYKKIMTVKGDVSSFEITKLDGKKLDQKKSVKIYVVAYRKVNGKYEKITQSVELHLVGKKNTKYSNAKAITVKKDAYTLGVNKTATIKPTLVLENSKKKDVEHVAKFRYQSTNTAVATVDKNGKIKAVGKGTCTIYIFANNGKLKSVKVTVK